MNDASPSNLKILPATAADLPEISRLAGVIWRAHYPGIISHEQIEYMLERMYNLQTLRDDLALRAIRYDRLLVGTELVGFAASGPADEPHTVKLHKLYLHPIWQGRGLGSLLLRHCADQAAQSGARRLILTVNKNNTKAIAAYLRNGFTILQPITADIGSGFIMDDFLLAKELT